MLMRFRDREKEMSGAEHETTNNRMELTAAIMALEALKKPCHVILTTDSQYVMNGITQWLESWKLKGWKTANRKQVKNIDLWQRLDAVRNKHEINWEWVRGHCGHPENERADELANLAIDKLLIN